MKKLILIFVLFLGIASFTQAATLRWGEVPDTDACQIAGYTVEFWAAPDQKYTYKTSELQVPDIETTFNLVPETEYNFSVSAYSTKGLTGPGSEPIQWAYQPKVPDNSLPPVVIYIPGQVKQIIIGNQ